MVQVSYVSAQLVKKSWTSGETSRDSLPGLSVLFKVLDKYIYLFLISPTNILPYNEHISHENTMSSFCGVGKEAFRLVNQMVLLWCHSKGRFLVSLI